MSRITQFLRLPTVLLLLSFCFACTGPTQPQQPSPAPTNIIPTISPALTPKNAFVRIRRPVVAGQFYPQSRDALLHMVDDLLSRAQRLGPEPVVLIVPHAGYVYSGGVAAQAYKQAEGVRYDVIVIIGNNHYQPDFRDVSVYDGDAFETPLGLVPVDRHLAQALIDFDDRIVSDESVHYREHSIEVQIPFLQRVQPNVPIVPIIIGAPTEENCQTLSDALIRVLEGKKALVVVSTDMSHYPRDEDARRVDAATLAAIETMNADRVKETIRRLMAENISNLLCVVCGEGPLITGMLVAPRLGANQVTVLQYANSGDSPYGDKSRVVGYGAVMFWHWEPPNFTEAEKRQLLSIARQAIQEYLNGHNVPDLSPENENLLRRDGAFVTLKLHGTLRGCIGHMVTSEPLYRTIQECAISAATADPRFPPLTKEELSEIQIEISVLSPMKRVGDIEEIQVGVHGLMIVTPKGRGVLLPQVAVEEGWDRAAFLRGVCRKAGLPQDAWKQQDAALYRFTATVFGE